MTIIGLNLELYFTGPIMTTTFQQQLSGRQWTRLTRQVWRCNDGTRRTGLELVQLLLPLEVYAFPAETVERSSIGVVIEAGLSTWQRIE